MSGTTSGEEDFEVVGWQSDDDSEWQDAGGEGLNGLLGDDTDVEEADSGPPAAVTVSSSHEALLKAGVKKTMRLECEATAHAPPTAPVLSAAPVGAVAGESLPAKVRRVCSALELPGNGGLVRLVREANAALGIEPTGNLVQQTDTLLVALFGVDDIKAGVCIDCMLRTGLCPLGNCVD